MKPGSLGHSVTSGLRWASLSRVLTQVVTWLTTLLVVRLLSPSDYGLAAMATVLGGYLAMWNELGFSVTLIQKRTVDEETLRSVFGILLLVGVVLMLMMLIGAPLIARMFAEQRVTPLARLAALSFLIMPFTIIPYAQLSIEMNFKSISVVSFLSASVGALVTLTLAFKGFGAYALIIGTLATTLARGVVLNWMRPFLKWPNVRLKRLKEFASFSGNVMLTRTIWYWYGEADNLIIGRLLGTGLLGVYSLGRQLAEMPMDRIAEIVNMVSLPAYSSVGSDVPRVRDAYLRTLGLISTLAFPLFWGLAVVADDLIHAVLGAKWMAAVPILQILCISLPVRMMGTLASAPLLAIGRADRQFQFVAFPAVIVPVCIAIAVRWGINGVAAAWSIGYPIAFLLACNWSKGVLQSSLRKMLVPMLAPAFSALVMVAAVYGYSLATCCSMPALVTLVVKVAIGCIIYIGTLAVLSRPRFDDALSFARSLVMRSGQ